MSAAVVLGVFTVGFAAFHGPSRAWLRPEQPASRHHARRLLGLLCYGALPCAAALALDPTPSAWGLGLGDPARGTLGALGLAGVVSPIVWQSARGAAHQAHYPQIRATRWTPRLLAASLAGWAAYLLGYEFAFRGLLLFGLIPTLGVEGAVAASTALYVLAHAEKDTAEVVATVPMGVAFAALALWSGAIWACVLLHLWIAALGELAAIHHSPDRAFTRGDAHARG